MEIALIDVVNASFELLPRPLGPGWVVRVSGEARSILHRAAPFVARVGGQRVEGVAVSAAGDSFQGFLRAVPKTGDRLYVGYSTAAISTRFTFQPSPRPSV